MKSFLILTLGISIVLEATLFSYPLTLVVIGVLATGLGIRASVLAIVAGLILDLFLLRTIGQTSLFYLSVCWLASRYQKKIYVGNIFYYLIFFAVISTIYTFIFNRFISAWIIAGFTLSGIIINLVLYKQIPAVFEDKKKLSI